MQLTCIKRQRRSNSGASGDPRRSARRDRSRKGLNRGKDQPSGNRTAQYRGRPVSKAVSNQRDLRSPDDAVIEGWGDVGLKNGTPEKIERGVCRFLFYSAVLATSAVPIKEGTFARRHDAVGSFVQESTEASAAKGLHASLFASSQRVRNRSRAVWRRDRTVPTGTCMSAATSS